MYKTGSPSARPGPLSKNIMGVGCLRPGKIKRACGGHNKPWCIDTAGMCYGGAGADEAEEAGVQAAAYYYYSTLDYLVCMIMVFIHGAHLLGVQVRQDLCKLLVPRVQ